MSFKKSIEVCFQNYFTFSGRASRSEYWWFTLFNCLVVMVLLWLVESIVPLYQAIVIIPSLAVGSRRLHDTGKSGWWQLILLVPVIGWIILVIFLILNPEEGTNKYGPPLNEDGLADIDAQDEINLIES